MNQKNLVELQTYPMLPKKQYRNVLNILNSVNKETVVVFHYDVRKYKIIGDSSKTINIWLGVDVTSSI